MTIRVCVLNDVIAVAGPAVKIIAVRRLRDPVLRLIRISANGRHLSSSNFRASLRRCNLRFTLAHDHNRVAVGMHFDSEYSVVMRWMNRHVRRVDLRFGFAVLRYRITGKALADLDLNVLLREVGDVRLRVRSQSESVGIVELQFRAGTFAG
jgi:hypothetical protein